MTNSLICQGTTKDCVDFFDKRIETFEPVEKVFCFFESANFLLSPYTIDSSYIHMVLENEDGKIMQLAGTNCGYNGTGPHGTAHILERLGFTRENALQIVQNTGIQIHFKKYPSGERYYNILHNVFFERTDLSNTTSFLPLCSIDAATIALPHKRVVSFIEPDKNNLAGFLNCLEIMAPLRVDFALDNNPIQDNAPRSGDVINKYISESKGLSKNLPLNVIVYGKKFDLHCFVNEANIGFFLQVIHYFLFKKRSELPALNNMNIQGGFFGFLFRALGSLGTPKKTNGSFEISERGEK